MKSRNTMTQETTITPRTAVGYLRVSTDMQEESGLGLDSQKDQIKTYADSKGIEIVGWYSDTASGASHVDDRDGLSALVKNLEPNQSVLVAKRDRLSRDLMLSLWIEKEISRVHCTLESCDGAGNGDSPTDVLLKNLILAFGEFERNMISERTRAAMKELGKKRKLGRPSYGYKYDENGIPVEDPKTYPSLLRIKELHAEGHNPNKIARIMNSEGHRSSTGKDFSRSSMNLIICREFSEDKFSETYLDDKGNIRQSSPGT